MLQTTNICKKLLQSSFLATVGALVTGMLLSAPVSAAFPGENGKVVFTSNRDGNFEIYSTNKDGTEQTNLTNHADPDFEPQWSPDGTKILFRSQRNATNDLYLMNADGSNLQQITTGGGVHGSFSPDGTKIVFSSSRDGNNEIYTMDADGTNIVRLTNVAQLDAYPKYSPDGTKILFRSDRDDLVGEIYVMNNDGLNVTRLTNSVGSDTQPDWSPDGTKIVFYSTRSSNGDIWTMNADGSNPTQITTDLSIQVDPSWSPDGDKLSFQSLTDGDYEVVISDIDGSSQEILTNNTFTDQNARIQPLTLSPTATNDSNLTTPVNTALTIDVLDNDTDTYGSPDPTSVTISNQPGSGTVSVDTTSGEITYTPDTGFTGSDSFTYQVCSSESSALCDTATVSLTVLPGLPKTGGEGSSQSQLPLIVATAAALSGLGLPLLYQKARSKK